MSDDPDVRRFRAEPAKDSGAERSPFQRDRARVLHSAGFRRLATKTQVHSAAGSDDFLRTRLTHSLEVAQIAREMGGRLGCEPDLVDTAGLAHDLGHPPFGHNGEDALDEVAQPCGGFEGNAQTLRVLTRLEAKVPGAGLNLTRASLDATCKYPWDRRPEQRKFGVYPDDAEVFGWLRAGAEPGRRCLEAQVMDWADDVAYSVHDVEDGIHGGFVALAALRDDPDERAALCADVAVAYSPEPLDTLAAGLAELLADPVLAPLPDYDGSHAAQVALKRFTSVLTGRFVAAAVAATRAAAGDRPVAVVAGDLTDPAGLSDLDGTVDLVVCNPPYVPAGTPVPPEVADHDPPEAVFAGPDGLAVIRPVIARAARLLRPGGWLGLEHHETHPPLLPPLLQPWFIRVADHRDLAGRPRYLTGQRVAD